MVDQFDDDVLMEIEVKFGKGRSDSVVVRRSDNPTDLAKVFVVLIVTWLHLISKILFSYLLSVMALSKLQSLLYLSI